MPDDASYLRYPSVRGELLAFVADDDLWLVATSGGTARRLTSEHTPVADARLSPDGTKLAFTGRVDGRPEAYVVAVDGGPVRRLSYLGDSETGVIGWSDEDHLLITSAAGQPFTTRTWAYALDLGGGPPERLPFGPVTAIARGPNGAVVLGAHQSLRRGAGWKRYRGGTAGSLWIDRDGSGTFDPFLVELGGQLEDPMFVNDRLVFVSDHEGVGNLYSVLLDGSDLRRHSDHGDFYARAASSDGERVVYQCASDLWRIDDLAADAQPTRIDIELGTPRSGRARRVLHAEEELGDFAVDHEARASVVEVRGSMHWLTHRQGPARYLFGGNGVRGRLPRVAGSGEAARVIAISDAEGDDALEVHAVHQGDGTPPRRIGAGQIGRVLELTGSPDGRRAALATHDGRVLVADLASGELTTLSTNGFGDSSGLTFSPDSAWLAWSEKGPEPLRQIKLARLDGGEVIEATPLRFDDHDPVFTLDGKYLAFLSVRTFDPAYDAQVFDMFFAAGARPYLIPLAASTPSPFDPEVEGRPRSKPDKQDNPEDSGGVPAVVVEPEGMAERIVALPVESGRYSSLRAAKGALLYLASSLVGVLGEARPALGAEPPKPRLVRFDLDKAKEDELLGELDAFAVSGDGTAIVVRSGPQLRVLAADHRVEPKPGETPDPAERIDVDLSRIRVELDPPAEWRQMFDETARLMRDHYWIADMAGVDWDGVVERYRPLLDKVATRDDLSELIWEVQGELGTSHAYERPVARPVDAERRLGLLGADLERDGEHWRVAAVLPGEPSVLEARSPLAAPGVGVHAGDRIVGVDGHRVDPERGPQALLVGAARKAVELTVSPSDGDGERRVVVEPLADERPLRYQAWVTDRRAFVHNATDGKVGYLHVPDMMGAGWAQFHRDLHLEVARDALIVDVRDNRGGHVSELVLEKVGRIVRGWDTGRHTGQQPYPSDSPRGPRVLLTNEWAGSDGDIVTAGFRQRGLGPVIGTRTWGGVIGIDGRYSLVDGTVVTQPRYAFWFDGGFGWDVENHGVDPDIEVLFPPQDYAAGRDPQLERAIEVVLDLLERQPAARPPDPATRPSRAAPPLPPRP